MRRSRRQGDVWLDTASSRSTSDVTPGLFERPRRRGNDMTDGPRLEEWSDCELSEGRDRDAEPTAVSRGVDDGVSIATFPEVEGHRVGIAGDATRG